MTRVCVRCGWFVFDHDRCGHCGGPTISHKAATKGCGVPGLFELLHVSPAERVLSFQSARRNAAT